MRKPSRRWARLEKLENRCLLSAQPIINLTLSQDEVAEGDSAIIVKAVATSDGATPVEVSERIVVRVRFDGDDQGPEGFEASGQVMQILPGESESTEIQVSFPEDEVVEETSQLRIVPRIVIGEGTIDDSSAVSLSISDNDRSDLSVQPATSFRSHDSIDFQLRLSAPVLSPVTAFVSTVDGSAVGGVDFESLRDFPVTFQPLETEAIVSVPILSGQVDEIEQAFHLSVNRIDAVGLPVNGQTITLAQPRVEVGDVTAFEILPDGRVLYVADATRDSEPELFVADLANASVMRIAGLSRFVSVKAHNGYAYYRESHFIKRLPIAEAAASETVVEVDPSEPFHHTLWFHENSEYLIYRTDKFYRASLGGEEPAVPLFASTANDATFSENGKFIFTVERNGDHDLLRVVELANPENRREFNLKRFFRTKINS